MSYEAYICPNDCCDVDPSRPVRNHVKPLVIDGEHYAAFQDAAAALDMNRGTLEWRMKHKRCLKRSVRKVKADPEPANPHPRGTAALVYKFLRNMGKCA